MAETVISTARGGLTLMTGSVCRQQYGRENVILSDIVKAPSDVYDNGA